VLQEPTYPDSVLARHAVREKAVTNRVTKMVTSLEKQLTVIEAELLLTPRDLNLLKIQMEVESKLDVAKFELPDVVEVKTTADEGTAFSNAETLADPYKGKTPLPRVPNYQETFASCHPNTWNATANQYLEQSPETRNHRIHSFPPIATE
jgi:hypothetical protein